MCTQRKKGFKCVILRYLHLMDQSEMSWRLGGLPEVNMRARRRNGESDENAGKKLLSVRHE